MEGRFCKWEASLKRSGEDHSCLWLYALRAVVLRCCLGQSRPFYLRMQIHRSRDEALSVRQQNQSGRAGGQMSDSYASFEKPCRVSGTRQRAMALFSWRTTRGLTVCCLVVMGSTAFIPPWECHKIGSPSKSPGSRVSTDSVIVLGFATDPIPGQCFDRLKSQEFGHQPYSAGCKSCLIFVQLIAPKRSGLALLTAAISISLDLAGNSS